MRACADRAAIEYVDEVANANYAVKFEGLKLDNFDLKVRGVYRRPLTSEWHIHFHSRSGKFNESWEIRFLPKPDASDENHIEEIKHLLHSRREMR